MENDTYFMEKVWIPIPQAFPIRRTSLTFLMLWESWWENPCIFHAIKYTIGWNLMEKSTHTMGKIWVPISQVLHIQWVLENITWTQFPRLSQFIGFGCLFPPLGNWWANACISYVMKYTIKLKFKGKTASILWEKYEYQFPRFSQYNGF